MSHRRNSIKSEDQLLKEAMEDLDVPLRGGGSDSRRRANAIGSSSEREQPPPSRRRSIQPAASSSASSSSAASGTSRAQNTSRSNTSAGSGRSISNPVYQTIDQITRRRVKELAIYETMLFPLLEPDYDIDDWIDELMMDCYIGGRSDLLLRDANNFERYPRIPCDQSDLPDIRENDISGEEELNIEDELHTRWRESNIDRIERIDNLRLECVEIHSAEERYRRYSVLPRWMGNILMRSVADTKLGVYDSLDDEDDEEDESQNDERIRRPASGGEDEEREINRHRRYSRMQNRMSRSSRRFSAK